MLVGRWTEANATAEETVRLAEDTGQVELEAHALVWRALIAAWQGNEEASGAFLDRGRAITATRPMSLVDDASRWVIGTVELGAGRPASALARLEAISHPVITVLASLDRIEAAVLAGRDDQARSWLEELAAFADAADAGWARARLAHCRAVVATDPDEKEAFFVEALTQHAVAERRFERARSELAYGEFLRRQRRRVDAREHLRAALETFFALDAKHWTERARAELRASGETVRARLAEDVTHLTPQEFQIAHFVSQGLSNREVAAQLFLSPRTIDFHLRNVFNKLGIASRTELASLELGLHAPPQSKPAYAKTAD
jgi:DNA-binding CsgD family transcriptional regulator